MQVGIAPHVLWAAIFVVETCRLSGAPIDHAQVNGLDVEGWCVEVIPDLLKAMGPTAFDRQSGSHCPFRLSETSSQIGPSLPGTSSSGRKYRSLPRLLGYRW